MGKMLAAERRWKAAEACLQTFGGFGYAREYGIERKWRESRLYQTAPISTNMVLAFVGQNILGMPRSYRAARAGFTSLNGSATPSCTMANVFMLMAIRL